MSSQPQQIIEENHFDNRKLKVYTNRPKNLTELLCNTIEKFPDQEAIVQNDTRLNYKTLGKMVNDVAYNLAVRWGVQKGDRVAIFLENCIEFCSCIFAVAQLGGISVPVNTRLRSKEIEFMLNNSGARLLVMDSIFWSEIEPIRDKVNLDQIFFIGDTELSPGILHYNDLMQAGQGAITREIDEEDTAIIMYTSGTTGLPKGAMEAHMNIIHTCINYQQIMKTSSEERTLISIPLFHVTGLFAQLIHVFYVGGTAVLMRRFQTKTFMELLEKEKITFNFAVPTIYVLMLMQLGEGKNNNLQSLRIAAYGGAPMAPTTIESFLSYFPKLRMYNCYGATETASPTTILDAEEALRKSNSVGRPVPVAQCKVVDEKGSELPDGQVGELWIKGPMVVPGYWQNREANEREFTDGFWHSGDLAMIDQQGFVYIMDRKKDMINRGGEKIFSVEVEDVLYSHPKVMEAAVVGVPDPIFGEQVKAVLVLREGVAADIEEIRSFVASKLADYKIPKFVEFRDALPRNPGGKVIKSALK